MELRDLEQVRTAPLEHGKNKLRFEECYTCFGYETETVVERILLIFQCRPTVPVKSMDSLFFVF